MGSTINIFKWIDILNGSFIIFSLYNFITIRLGYNWVKNRLELIKIKIYYQPYATRQTTRFFEMAKCNYIVGSLLSFIFFFCVEWVDTAASRDVTDVKWELLLFLLRKWGINGVCSWYDMPKHEKRPDFVWLLVENRGIRVFLTLLYKVALKDIQIHHNQSRKRIKSLFYFRNNLI